MSHGEHHFQKRKQIYSSPESLTGKVRRAGNILIHPIKYQKAKKTFEPYPHPNFLLRFVDHAIYFKEKPIVVIHGTMVVCNIVIVSGALLYG